MSGPGVSETGFACRCGAVRGRAELGGGFHVRCFCESCRGTARLAGAPDPGRVGVPLVQVTPDRVRLDAGAERLEPLRLFAASKVLRWRARCCGDVLFSTAPTPALPVLGLVDRVMDAPEAAGPERARVYLPPARPGGRQRHDRLGAFVVAFARRTAAALARRARRRDPLAAGGRYPEPRAPSAEEMARGFPDGAPL